MSEISLYNNKKDINIKSKLIGLCPYIVITIFDDEINALIDTGSQLTCISEKYYEKLKERREFNELPVSNIMVVSAFGKKSSTVRKQI